MEVFDQREVGDELALLFRDGHELKFGWRRTKRKDAKFACLSRWRHCAGTECDATLRARCVHIFFVSMTSAM
jgi:hypothetical protein